MGIGAIVIVRPFGQLLHNGSGIVQRIDMNIVPFNSGAKNRPRAIAEMISSGLPSQSRSNGCTSKFNLPFRPQ